MRRKTDWVDPLNEKLGLLQAAFQPNTLRQEVEVPVFQVCDVKTSSLRSAFLYVSLPLLGASILYRFCLCATVGIILVRKFIRVPRVGRWWLLVFRQP
jgi:hypothetical protein